MSLGRFELRDEPGIGHCWCPPSGVTALIDLVPPQQDPDPDVNFGLMLSDSPLNSSVCHHSFGSGDVREIAADGMAYDAWESVTGIRPQAGLATIANLLTDHLTFRSDPVGGDSTKPLTAGLNRHLEINLGGQVWSHQITGITDLFAEPTMRVEAEGLATIFKEQGETQYRLAMGALRKKYDTRPIKDLIVFLKLDGRDDLPLMDELTPQTIKTENWNSGTFPAMNNTWSSIAGSWSSPSSGLCRATNAGNSRLLLSYSFGGSDFRSTFVMKTTTGPGIISRSDATVTTYYLGIANATAGTRLIYKAISGTQTLLSTAAQSWAINDIPGINPVGSTIILLRNGTAATTITDTAVTSGTYAALYNSGNGQSDFGQVIVDDLVSATNRRRRVICCGGIG